MLLHALPQCWLSATIATCFCMCQGGLKRGVCDHVNFECFHRASGAPQAVGRFTLHRCSACAVDPQIGEKSMSQLPLSRPYKNQ